MENSTVIALPAYTQTSQIRLQDKKSLLKKLQENLTTFFAELHSRLQSSPMSDASGTRSAGNGNFNRKMKKNAFIIIPVIVVLVLVIGLFTLVLRSNGSKPSVLGDQRVNIEKPKATETLNKEFSYPLKDETGKEVSKLKFLLQNAELRDQIVIKGTKATAVEGRTFLVINMKITNPYSKAVQINARDYFRLSVNKSDERLAPDIHNDPVEVQAISTKITRIGFPINDTDKNLTLYVGEITGPKQAIELHLQ